MADHTKPDAASNYSTGFFNELNARLNNLAKQSLAGDTNLAVGAVTWNVSSNRWEKWSGSAWGDLSTLYVINVDKHDGYDAGNAAGQIPVSNGTVCATLNADKHDGYDAGNSSGQVPINNGTLNVNLNAEKLGGATGSQYARLDAASNFTTAPTISSNVVWHAGNDGAGSGLDADLLDGYTTSSNTTGNTIALRTATGELYATQLRSYTVLDGLGAQVYNVNQAVSAVLMYASGTTGYSVSNATMYVGKNTSTSRSINAGGTINASGADYAEYERKRADCEPIRKGDVVGFDDVGQLTDRWALAVNFGVKSTDPSYVGGDTWGAAEQIGMAEPAQVDAATVEAELAAEGTVRPAAEAWRALGVDDVARVAKLSAARQQEIYDRQRGRTSAAYRRAVAAFESILAERLARRLAEHSAARASFDAAVEAARGAVDRIAYAGKVPVNVRGAQPGDYVVATEAPDGGITGRAVPADAITFEEYRLAVGQVRRILEDGRPEAVVKAC